MVAGSFSSGSGAVDGSVVILPSRTEAPEGKTSLEKLFAGAHGSCFAMALSLVLGQANATPEQLVVRARCILDAVDEAPKITRSTLEVTFEATFEGTNL